MKIQMKNDFQYIVLNFFVNRIPSWGIRKMLYRLSGIKIGEGSRIGIGTIVENPSGIEIGRRSIINEFCHLDGRGGLIIGNDVSVSVYSVIISASHKSNSNNFQYYKSKVIIGNRVWIGTRAVILDGSRIKNNAIIGAGCVFKGVAEENSISVPSKPRKLGERLKCDYKLNYKPYFR